MVSSVQGIEVDHTARDISFCGHAITLNKPLSIHGSCWHSGR